MNYKITPEQVKLMMDDILKRKNIKVDIVYRIHTLHTNLIAATVYLYKDDQVFGFRFGYDFVFKYDKRFDTLTPESHSPKIERFDFLKMIPESVILKYFTDKTEEYLRGYLDRGNVPAFKRLVSEELDTTKSNYEKQVAVLKRLLKSKSFEGVCGYNFVSDIGDDGIARVIVKFAEEWYRSSDDTRDLNRKVGTMSTIKLEIKEIGKKFLGIENFYVGSYLVKCNSSLNEQQDTKSNYEKQVDVLERLLKSKDYEGVCRYNFTDDKLRDRVAGVQVIFSSDWYRQNEDSKYLNIQLIKIQTTKLLIKKLAEKYLGMENLYVGSYLEDCNSSLNEQETPKDVAFHKALKRVIPDGSVYKSDYPLPYSDEGDVHVIMKYSVLPSSRIMKMRREDGSLYDAIQVHLQIDELLWKSDFDKEWERVDKTQSLPSNFWSMFEDDISDLVYKKMGLEYVEVYYKYPPIH